MPLDTWISSIVVLDAPGGRGRQSGVSMDELAGGEFLSETFELEFACFRGRATLSDINGDTMKTEVRTRDP